MKNNSQTKKDFDNRIAVPANTEFPAFMGNREGIVKADKKNNVYVMDYSGNVRIARNIRIPNVWKLAVIVGYEKENPTLLQVLRMRNTYQNPPYPNLIEHADVMHTRWGYDPVFINNQQIIPGLATPYNASSVVVQFRGFNYYLDGWHTLNNTTIDFTAEIPASGACWVMAQVDTAGIISLVAGVVRASREILTPEDIPLYAGGAPLFAVKCYFGQTRFVQTKTVSDIYDMRFTGVSTGGSGQGDMFKAVYDPQNIYADVFDFANMTGVEDLMLKTIYDPRFVEDDAFVKMQRSSPANPFKGMLWYNTTSDIVFGLVFTTSDNSMYLGAM